MLNAGLPSLPLHCSQFLLIAMAEHFCLVECLVETGMLPDRLEWEEIEFS